jgi:two-component system cell cycle response regulator
MSGRILIADGVATNRIVLKVRLAEARYDTIFAADAETCLRLAKERAPDIIMLDRSLPDMDGCDLVRQLRSSPATRDLPLLMIVANGDPQQRLAALRAGADDVLSRPFDEPMLMARLRCLMRGRDDGIDLGARQAALGAIGAAEAGEPFDLPGRFALVTERPEASLRWRKDLGPHLRERLLLLSRDEALKIGPDDGNAPDVFVIDADLGAAGSGLRLMSDLRCRAGSRHAAICMILPEAAGAAAAMAFDLGADDLVAAGVDPPELALRLRALLRRKRRGDRLRASVEDGLRLAMIDPLTGLYNRRFAMAQLGRLLAAPDAPGKGTAVMVIDLDRFKTVNDRWGHAAGDSVLAEVARRLASVLSDGDLLARIGGEEFLVALPEVSLPEARRRAEDLRDVVNGESVELPDGTTLAVTVSIGLALSLHPRAEGRLRDRVAQLIDSADRALMAAKAEGRNKVTISRNAA